MGHGRVMARNLLCIQMVKSMLLSEIGLKISRESSFSYGNDWIVVILDARLISATF